MKRLSLYFRSHIKYVLVFLTILFVAISIFFNLWQQRTLVTNLEMNMKKDNATIAADIQFFFEKYVLVVRLMAEDEYLVDYIRDVDSQEKRLESIYYNDAIQSLNNVKAADELITYPWIGLGRINSYVTQNPMVNLRPIDPNYDFEAASWYEALTASMDSVTVSSIYESYLDKTAVFSVVAPVFDSSEGSLEPIGQIAVNLDASAMSAIIRRHTLAEKGYVYVFDEDNHLIASSDGLSDHHGDPMDGDRVGFYLEGMTIGGRGVVKKDINGDAYYISFSDVGFEGMKIATFAPVSEINDQMVFLNVLSVVIVTMSVLILFVTLALGRMGSRVEALDQMNRQLNDMNSQLERQEKHIKSLADSDPLTKIANRRKFNDCLKHALEENSTGCVLILDIDNFKDINDTRGHVWGDKLLVMIAERLKKLEAMGLFVSRFGGDEFLLMSLESGDHEGIIAMVEKVTALFDRDFDLQGEAIRVTVSVGVSRFPEDSKDMDALIMYADTAMYSVKTAGKNNYALFDLSMRDGNLERATIDKVLKNAIEDHGFMLCYQPQIDIYKEVIVGCEALLRLKDYSISPAQFIPVAEESGKIIEIGRWVAEEAIRQQAKWLEHYGDSVPVSINYSVKQLKDKGYIKFLEDKLQHYGVPAKLLHIEVTESILIDDESEVMTFINDLKDMGMSVLLDDFGSGYSAINYLTYIPIDKLKLDKSLADQFLVEDKFSFLGHIIDLALSLDIEPVIEGIERAEQISLLKQSKCKLVQGYYYSKPLQAKDLGRRYFEG